MKRIIVAAVAVMTFGCVSAQENIIKLNPLSLIGGTDLISFEHKLGDNTSLLGGLGAGGFSFGDAKYTNFGGEVQYRYYFAEALKGFYAGGQVGYAMGKVKATSVADTNFGVLKIGGKGGYQWVWGSGFSLDLNLGIAYNNFNYKNESVSSHTYKGSGVLPNFGFALGYAF